MVEYILIMAIGALASVLANRGVAVFNDGFRPLMPQYFEGKISRAELAAMSFAISFGLVIGFGIPTSVAASIILIHCILLTTDMIGTFCPDTTKGAILAAVIGALYGFLILFGLQAVINFFAYLPYNFLDPLGKVSAPITVAFAIFPSIALAYQHGFKKGLISGILTILVYFATLRFGSFSLGSFNVTLNATGMAMLFGMILMIAFAATVKSEGQSTNQDLTNVFSKQVARIQKNWPLLALMGGLLAAATSLSIVAGDPTSLNLLDNGAYSDAAMAALARAIGFVPLVFTTAIATGVYGVAGCTFVFVVGLAFHGNPLLAGVLGAAVIVLEVFLINFFAKVMDTFPGVRDMGEHIRTAMNKVLEMALLIGSAMAAEAMVSGVGSLFVIGCYLLNRSSKKPIVDLAVGPVAAILFGILINILVVVGLYVLPVVG
ncbi:MAG: YhfT family protein [Anaerorhabdus sp.]